MEKKSDPNRDELAFSLYTTLLARATLYPVGEVFELVGEHHRDKTQRSRTVEGLARYREFAYRAVDTFFAKDLEHKK